VSKVEYLKPNYPRDAFEGTAEFYSQYRIPYPQALFDDLISRVKPEHGVLLDLASGPGRVCIPLAPFFSKVYAIDIDPGMVSVGKAESKKYNASNIEWFTGRAEEFNIEPGSIDLITIGDAFDRLDQSLILDLANKWLRPGGSIAIIGMYSIWLGEEPWHKMVSEFIKKWASKVTSCLGTNYRNYGLMLEDKSFINAGSYTFEFTNHCTIDSIIGYLYSTSRCSKKVLADDVSEFESGIRTELSKLNEKGIFSENITCGYTLGQKPS
jgi:ubiquinone/menaquinone biosynthesis C-methylase UbiE